jgi:hypothetical protein
MLDHPSVIAADNSAEIATKIVVSRQSIVARYDAPLQQAMLRRCRKERDRRPKENGASVPTDSVTAAMRKKFLPSWTSSTGH